MADIQNQASSGLNAQSEKNSSRNAKRPWITIRLWVLVGSLVGLVFSLFITPPFNLKPVEGDFVWMLLFIILGAIVGLILGFLRGKRGHNWEKSAKSGDSKKRQKTGT
jgi:F0F1-type ATP synthase assembly protein I